MACHCGQALNGSPHAAQLVALEPALPQVHDLAQAAAGLRLAEQSLQQRGAAAAEAGQVGDDGRPGRAHARRPAAAATRCPNRSRRQRRPRARRRRADVRTSSSSRASSAGPARPARSPGPPGRARRPSWQNRCWWSSTCSSRPGSRGTTTGRWPAARAWRWWPVRRGRPRSGPAAPARCSSSKSRNAWPCATVGAPALPCWTTTGRVRVRRGPLVQPLHQPVEGVVVGAEQGQHPVGELTAAVPTSWASRYSPSCSGHCTSISGVNGPAQPAGQRRRCRPGRTPRRRRSACRSSAGQHEERQGDPGAGADHHVGPVPAQLTHRQDGVAHQVRQVAGGRVVRPVTVLVRQQRSGRPGCRR